MPTTLDQQVVQDYEVEQGGMFDSVSDSIGPAPWWVISGAFHGLLLLLVTLISIALVRPSENDVVVTTIMEKAKPPEYEVKKPRDVFKTTVQVPEDTQVDHPVVTHDVVEVSERVETANDMDMQKARGDSNDAISDVNLSGLSFIPSIGLGGGKGGAFGQRDQGGRRRRVTDGGGSQETESSVEAALKWLANHQEADGHWDTKKYNSNQKTDTACTGMALLAFLGAGHTEKIGKYKDNVKRAVGWLKAHQNADGLVFDQTDAGAHRGTGYPHSIAGMALAEAAGMAKVSDTVNAAQKAISYSVDKHQNGSGYDKLGFRYQPKQKGDLSVTGWFTMQLKSAKVAGLMVDHQNFQGVINFLDSVERKGAGGDKGYGPASIYAYTVDDDHASTSHRLTAIGNLCRQFMGYKKDDLQASISWFVEKGGLPDGWGEGKTDLYYWYYGTLCTFQQGGDIWKRWNEAMKKTLCGNQCKGGDDDGSWDPVGDYSKEWGRVGQTALSALCLEVYYRYLPMYK